MSTFAGIHIECSKPASHFGTIGSVVMTRTPDWSETFTAAGTTTNVGFAGDHGTSIVTLLAEGADWWASFGPSPGDPLQTATTRVKLQDGQPRSFDLRPGLHVRVAPNP